MNIPSLPVSAMVNKDGYITDEYRQFFDQLISELQQNASEEGLVSPSQDSANIAEIQNNQLGNGQYSCPFGNSLYNSTANSIMFTIDDGSGKPIFKTVTLT